MKNFNQLIQTYFGKLSEEELTTIKSFFREEHLAKNEYFTRAGKVCNKLSIVKSGILRIYAISDEGKDITQWITTENYLITEAIGFFFNEPNRWNIQTYTDTELLTLSKSSYLKLCDALPKWHEIEKRFIIKCFAMLEDRVFSHLSMSAEERYERYYQQNKELFNQVPLHHIASVLGMSAETFSRIRKKQTLKP